MEDRPFKFVMRCLTCGKMVDPSNPTDKVCKCEPVFKPDNRTDDTGTDYTHEINVRLRQNIDPENN